LPPASPPALGREVYPTGTITCWLLPFMHADPDSAYCSVPVISAHYRSCIYGRCWSSSRSAFLSSPSCAPPRRPLISIVRAAQVHSASPLQMARGELWPAHVTLPGGRLCDAQTAELKLRSYTL
jgi:hypothetical protein